MEKSLYKRNNKLKNATPLQKAVSKFQRKVDALQSSRTELFEKLTMQNRALNDAHKLIGWLISQKRLTKEECKKFIRRKSEIREELKKDAKPKNREGGKK